MSDSDQTTAEQATEDSDAAIAAEKARRRRVALATVILLIGLPIYLIVVAWVLGGLTAPVVAPDGTVVDAKPLHWAVELAIYVGFGLVWALPLKRLFKGLGKPAAPR